MIFSITMQTPTGIQAIKAKSTIAHCRRTARAAMAAITVMLPRSICMRLIYHIRRLQRRFLFAYLVKGVA
jgi:hypothetical protein